MLSLDLWPQITSVGHHFKHSPRPVLCRDHCWRSHPMRQTVFVDSFGSLSLSWDHIIANNVMFGDCRQWSKTPDLEPKRFWGTKYTLSLWWHLFIGKFRTICEICDKIIKHWLKLKSDCLPSNSMSHTSRTSHIIAESLLDCNQIRFNRMHRSQWETTLKTSPTRVRPSIWPPLSPRYS